MRSVIVVLTTFMCCFICIFTIMTIGSHNLQNDEIERAMDYALEQTARKCIEEQIKDDDSIVFVAADAFQSQINSNRGTLVLSVLYADENIVDLHAAFVYTQYNGTEKEITKRKTIIRDWEEDYELDAIIRGISEKYLNVSPDAGGLKANSVWKTDSLLQTVLGNKQVDGVWENVQLTVEMKTESKAETSADTDGT